MAEIHQVLVRLLDGKHKALNFTTPSISGESVKQRIREITSIPIHHQILLSNGHHLLDHQALASNGPPATVHLLLRLRGGKGGFGSLLRGAATKAGQKKTNNFDACRDMSGRRLRHVNAEKKLEEWMAEAEERKLEKIAEEYIKKKSKAVKKGGPSGETEKYVEKYRKDSAKCMEEVERTVRESFKGFVNSKKRAVEAKGSEAKRLKIWLGKRKSGDSDSDDSDIDDSSDDDNEEETEKSVIDNNENNPDSNNGTDGSSGSVTGGKADVVSSGSGSDLEETVLGEEREGEEPSLKMNEENSVGSCLGDGVTLVNDEAVEKRVEESSENGCLNKEEVVVVALPPGVSSSGEGEEKISVTVQPVVCQEEAVSTSEGVLAVEKPLNFDEFSSAAEMEVLGMERLKSELQARGLKCGGTLQERAARLFLLKTTPLEKLPKKLLAKK